MTLPFLDGSPTSAPLPRDDPPLPRMCCALTKQGRPCACLAKPDSAYCGRHTLYECAICLCDIERHGAIKLPCGGHVFHKACMSKCVTPTCPLCRAMIPADVCVTLFQHTRITPMAERIYALPTTELQSAVFTMLDGILTIAENYTDPYVSLLQDILYWFGCMLGWNRVDLVTDVVNTFANLIHARSIT